MEHCSYDRATVIAYAKVGEQKTLYWKECGILSAYRIHRKKKTIPQSEQTIEYV